MKTVPLHFCTGLVVWSGLRDAGSRVHSSIPVLKCGQFIGWLLLWNQNENGGIVCSLLFFFCLVWSQMCFLFLFNMWLSKCASPF